MTVVNMPFTKQHCRRALIGLLLGCATGFNVAQAQVIPPPAGAGNIDPPAGAVNGSGNPTATTDTQPNWSQRLSSDDGGSDGCNSTRFKCIMPISLVPQAVLDKETGLVWQRSPSSFSPNWENAKLLCIQNTTGNRMGWRLPSVHEVASLMDPSSTPSLPAGHPFTNIQTPPDYWTVTHFGNEDSALAWTINFQGAFVFGRTKTLDSHYWCVRGGGPLSIY